jgi:hypothetical protein
MKMTSCMLHCEMSITVCGTQWPKSVLVYSFLHHYHEFHNAHTNQ